MCDLRALITIGGTALYIHESGVTVGAGATLLQHGPVSPEGARQPRSVTVVDAMCVLTALTEH
jgi:hypothetical protein